MAVSESTELWDEDVLWPFTFNVYMDTMMEEEEIMININEGEHFRMRGVDMEIRHGLSIWTKMMSKFNDLCEEEQMCLLMLKLGCRGTLHVLYGYKLYRSREDWKCLLIKEDPKSEHVGNLYFWNGRSQARNVDNRLTPSRFQLIINHLSSVTANVCECLNT